MSLEESANFWKMEKLDISSQKIKTRFYCKFKVRHVAKQNLVHFGGIQLWLSLVSSGFIPYSSTKFRLEI